MGGPDKIKLERYVEALEDPTSGLTYPALTGQRKQSVTDVERLFCSELLDFMEKKRNTLELFWGGGKRMMKEECLSYNDVATTINY